MTDVVSLALPICAVDVARLIGGKRQAVAAQVNAQFSISDAIPPYFDFSLHFEVALPPFGTAVFLLDAVDGACGGGDLASETAVDYAPHEQCKRPRAGKVDAVGAVAARVLRHAAGWSEPPPLAAPPPPPSPQLPPVLTLENDCLKVWVDTSYGLQVEHSDVPFEWWNILYRGTMTHELTSSPAHQLTSSPAHQPSGTRQTL